jgi:hypothetical protein
MAAASLMAEVSTSHGQLPQIYARKRLNANDSAECMDTESSGARVGVHDQWTAARAGRKQGTCSKLHLESCMLKLIHGRHKHDFHFRPGRR